MNPKRQGTLLLMLFSLLLLTSCDSGGNSNGNNATAQTPTASSATAPASAGKSKLNGVPPSQIVANVHTVKVNVKFDQVWSSPDGNKVLIGDISDVLIGGTIVPKAHYLNLVDLGNNGAITPISPAVEPTLLVDDASWSPDGSAFSYIFNNSPKGTGLETIYIHDMQSATDVPLALGSDVIHATLPVWGSSSKTIYFLALKQKGTDLMQVGRDGLGAKTMFSVSSSTAESVTLVAPTPDEKQFAFVVSNMDNFNASDQIFIADSDGGNRRKLGEEKFITGLHMSPRSDAVLVEQDGLASGNIKSEADSTILPLALNAASTGKTLPLPPVPITATAMHLQSYNAAWSPDGDKIAYLTTSVLKDLKVTTGLWIAQADGSEPTEVYSTTPQSLDKLLIWANNDTITWLGSDGLTVIQLEKKQ